MANKAFKYRIYPTASQRELLLKTFGCCRFVIIIIWFCSQSGILPVRHI